MRTLTATESSRSFAALLDDVEKGETVIVTRGGRRLAAIAVATRRTLITTDRAARFDELPGVDCVVLA